MVIEKHPEPKERKISDPIYYLLIQYSTGVH